MSRRLRAPNGLLFEYGPGLPAGGREAETVGCGHCQATVVYAKDEDMGGLCFVCWRLICGPCADKGVCEPWEEMLEKKETEFRARRTMGLT